MSVAPEVAEERVLVVPAAVLDGLGRFQGLSTDVERYLGPLLASDQLSYEPRAAMEEDPSYKQLIPYVLLRHVAADGAQTLFTYQRGGGGGETRLRKKRSVGVGGHVSTLDSHLASGHDAYRRGLERELAEEIEVHTPYTERVVGILNDDETPVGRVHLGVVHVLDLEAPRVTPREADLTDPRFLPVAEVLATIEDYESWSQIAVRALFGG
ncbi:MAG: phosphoesterase [Lacipirellulaceae bacterium]